MPKSIAWTARLRAAIVVVATLFLAAMAAPAAASLAAARTLTFMPAAGSGSMEAHYLEQRPDGTATLVSGPSRSEGRWSDDGQTLTIVHATPRFLFSTYSADLPDGVRQYLQNHYETGWVFRRVGGTIELGQADAVPLTYFVWAEGPLQGQTVVTSDAGSPGQRVEARRPGLRLPMAATEFPVGAQWAGVVTVPRAAGTSPSTVQDVLRIVTDRRAAGTDDIERMLWRVRNDALVLTRPTAAGAVQLRYWRMAADAASGAERWMLTVIDASGVVQAFECTVARVDPAFRFTPDGIVGDWSSTVSGLAPGDDLRFRFFADRSADQRTVRADGSVVPASPINAWEIQRSGTRLQLLRPANVISYGRWWVPVRRQGDWMVAMETLDYRLVSTGEQRVGLRRLGVYRYVGPAVR